MQKNPAQSTHFTQQRKPKWSPILWRSGAIWLAFLGPFFFLSYGALNYFTATRHDVGVIVANWERQIPFVPWLMLPYMSIDAFYAASLFLYRKKNPLNTHAKRLLLATLISLIGFLLYPLQFSFVVPKAQGFNGLLQAALLGFDKPYNQAPSLHISLLMVLWVCYAKKLTGAWRLILHVWFFAIAASVLLVYQHHFIDVWTGAIAGLIVLYALPNKPNYWRWQKPLKPHINIGLRYLFGSIILGFLAYQLFPIICFWVVFIDWLALSLCLVALAYAGFNQHIFQRHNGYISWPAKCVLAPYLLLSYISYVVYTQKTAPFSQITKHVYLGCFPSGHQQHGFTAVIDLTNEFAWPAFDAATNLINLNNLTSIKPQTYYFPMLDLVPSNPKMLAKAVLCLHNQQQNAQITPKILVNCALGLSRSACVVVTWLVWQQKASSMVAAITQVKEKRAGVVITEQHIAHMQQALAILNKRP